MTDQIERETHRVFTPDFVSLRAGDRFQLDATGRWQIVRRSYEGPWRTLIAGKLFGDREAPARQLRALAEAHPTLTMEFGQPPRLTVTVDLSLAVLGHVESRLVEVPADEPERPTEAHSPVSDVPEASPHPGLAPGWSLARLRQVGWMDPDDGSLYELDAEDDTRGASWVPVYVAGRDAVGLPPLDLDDDGGWDG